MALNDGSSNEKLYRFISDPGHKETLSGRVRAACVTCRRKKIKCSGDVPCTTCEEKGIICEGLRDRKRPRTNPDRRTSASSTRGDRRSSHDTRSDDGTNSSKRNSFDSLSKIDYNEDVLRRPTAHLRELGAESSFDSGYASSGQSKQDITASQARQLDTRFPFNYNLCPRDTSGSNYVPEISPSADALQDWSLNVRSTSISFPTTEIAGSDMSQIPVTTSLDVTREPVDWPDPGDQSNLLEDGRTLDQAATKMITAAEALEERAMDLRRLASCQERDFVEDTRRQSITFPIYPEGTAPQAFPMGVFPGPYDDLSLMLGGRTSTSGLTPIPLEFSSWWDINPGLRFTLEYQQSTNVASPANTTDGGWPYAPPPYDTQSTTAASHEPMNERTRLSASSPHTRQPARSNRAQLHDPYGRLYPWPE